MGTSGKPSVATVRYPRLVPKDDACAKELRKRTLTNLYNARPTWLANVHQRLDDAVFAGYGWPATLTDDELLAKLLIRVSSVALPGFGCGPQAALCSPWLLSMAQASHGPLLTSGRADLD